jgi:hypothetical protein
VGLAEFGWEEQVASSSLAASLPGDLLVWSGEPANKMLPIASQSDPIGVSPIVAHVNVGFGTISIPVYERIATERLVACLEDVKVPVGKPVQLEIEPERFGLIPKIRAKIGGKVVASLDLSAVSDRDLVHLLQSDGGWTVGGGEPACGYLARPLRVNDYVRLPKRIELGVVTRIEDIGTGQSVDEMQSWILGSGGFRVYVQEETSGSRSFQVTKHSEVHLH